ncbi:MAG: nitrogenase iron-molybdenum cofactor biosynthesis protein NifE, partial [Rhodospirillaceae bacterium]|nr:nitrogenase iron-molybdenum cofactor biosynthesis protein NifE [Rhodospirillaceae bacterium]
RRLHAIKRDIVTYDPAAVFVYTTCIPALTGDDMDAVCREAEARFGKPVVFVDAAGFYGAKQMGSRLAGDVMVKRVIGTREPDPIPDESMRPGITVHDVNLIGEYNIAGELWHTLPLLDELGIRVLCTLSGDARYREVQTMHRAKATMVVCARALVNVARQLEKRWRIPWFEGSFYGISDTSEALRNFARLIGDDNLTTRTEALIAREEAKAEATLAPWRKRLSGKRVLLYTGGVKSWSVVSALQDLGMQVVASGTRKSTEEDKARIRELMGENALLIEEGSAPALLQAVTDLRADMLIAGGRNQYTALKARLPFLDINQERDFAYAGYAGMAELARRMALSLESPIWPAVRGTAPWRSTVVETLPEEAAQ